MRREEAGNRARTHGYEGSRTYKTWQSMWTRCTNPNADGWKDYGGRGIKVSSRWSDFSAFLTDMGERPKGHTLDRVDVDGDYGPSNCRWATLKTQNRNRRNTLFVEFEGRKVSARDLAENLGLDGGVFTRAVKRYKDVGKALAYATTKRGTGTPA